MSTNKQRRAVYKFYRDLGYSAAEAGKLRNRTKTAIKDWVTEKKKRRVEQHERGAMRPRFIKPPLDVITKKDILKMRKELHEMGISKRAAYNMTRSKKKALFNKYSIDRLLDKMEKPTRASAKKAYKKMLKRWEEAQSTADIYNAIETAYTTVFGFQG